MVTVSELVTGKSLKGRGPVESRLDEVSFGGGRHCIANVRAKVSRLVFVGGMGSSSLPLI